MGGDARIALALPCLEGRCLVCSANPPQNWEPYREFNPDCQFRKLPSYALEDRAVKFGSGIENRTQIPGSVDLCPRPLDHTAVLVREVGCAPTLSRLKVEYLAISVTPPNLVSRLGTAPS
jgi:hypothetical protein